MGGDRSLLVGIITIIRIFKVVIATANQNQINKHHTGLLGDSL